MTWNEQGADMVEKIRGDAMPIAKPAPASYASRRRHTGVNPYEPRIKTILSCSFKLNIMAKNDKNSALEPDKDDLDVLQQEAGAGGYFGWFGTKKRSETKAMLKAELWQVEKNEPTMKYKVCIIYNIENGETFKESYFAGALYEDSGTLLTGLIDKIKDINMPSAIPFLNMFANQPQT